MRILNTEPGRFSPHAKEALRALGTVEDHEADRKFLLERAGTFDAWIIGLRHVIDEEVLGRATKLRCIATPTTGTDHIDVSAAQTRGIAILSLAGETKFLETISATAELTWGLLLALIRRIPAAHASVLAGDWARDRFRGYDLSGKTLGVVGYGRLGRMVSRYGRTFGMTVVAFDRGAHEREPDVEFVELSELLRRSDVVSVHLLLSKETDGVFSSDRFSEMKHGAVLINTARGKILDEDALLQALQSGKLAGAALDVLADETSTKADWLLRNELRAYAKEHDNLLITPHIGGMTLESAEKTNAFMIEKLARHLRAQGE